MKLRNEIFKNILIYVLVLVFYLVSINLFNKFYLSEYNQYRFLSDLVKAPISSTELIELKGEIEDKYPLSKVQELVDFRNMTIMIEIIAMIFITVIGFLIILLDIIKKFKMLDVFMKNSLKSIDLLQKNKKKYKYHELEKLRIDTNLLIEKVKKKNKKQQELYENIIHDFSTPIHIIKGNIELYENGLDIDIQTIKKEISRMEYYMKANLIKNEYEYTLFKDEDIIQYFETLKPVYAIEGVKLDIDIRDRFEFETKKENLFRVIDNIINNALKHSQCSKIKCSIYECDKKIIIEIVNNGIPLKEEEKQNLFKRANSKKSTGFGLSIVKSILDDLNYGIAVSSLQKETKFIIKIPLEGKNSIV